MNLEGDLKMNDHSHPHKTEVIVRIAKIVGHTQSIKKCVKMEEDVPKY